MRTLCITVTPPFPPDQPVATTLYGFRVPMGVASPFARPDYVSHVMSDDSSILKLVETKWILPALTRRVTRTPPICST